MVLPVFIVKSVKAIQRKRVLASTVNERGNGSHLIFSREVRKECR